MRVVVAIAVRKCLELVHQLRLARRQISPAASGHFPEPLLAPRPYWDRDNAAGARRAAAASIGRREHLFGNRLPQEGRQPGRFFEPPGAVQSRQQGQFGGNRIAGDGGAASAAGLCRPCSRLLPSGLLARSPAGRVAIQAKRPADHGQQRSEEHELHIPAESLPGNPPAVGAAVGVGADRSGPLLLGRIRLGALKIGRCWRQARHRRSGMAATTSASSSASANSAMASATSAGTAIALARILGQHRLVDLFQILGAVGAMLDQRRDGGHDVGHELLAAGVVGRVAVRGLSREQEEERAAEAVDVRADVGRGGVLPLFGRHVVDGAHGHARLRQAALRLGLAAPLGMKLGQPQVQAASPGRCGRASGWPA